MQNCDFTLKGKFRYFKTGDSSLLKVIDFGSVCFKYQYSSYYENNFHSQIFPKNILVFSMSEYWDEISLKEYSETLKLWVKDLEKDLFNE